MGNARGARTSLFDFTGSEWALGGCFLVAMLAVAFPYYLDSVHQARYAKAKEDLRQIARAIEEYRTRDVLGYPPLTLEDVGHAHRRDPWGNPYLFLNLATGTGNAMERTIELGLTPPISPRNPEGKTATEDRMRFQHAARTSSTGELLNTDYDLFSTGPDGSFRLPTGAPESRDDVVRARTGSFFGRADQL